MKKLIYLLALLALPAAAQTVVYDTNYFVITGAGTTNPLVNGTQVFQWNANGYWYQMTNGVSTYPDTYYNFSRYGTAYGSKVIFWGDNNFYRSTGFPTNWAVATNAPVAPGTLTPAPTGSYLAIATNWPTTTNWSTGLTNFWAQAGDVVTFGAAGKNLSAGGLSNQLTLLFNTNVIFQSPFTTGNRLPWSVAGSLQWDGTNINASAHMITGDTNSPFADAFTSVAATPGTNSFSLIVAGDTNGLTVDAANITAVRAPIGDVVSHVYPPATVSGGGGGAGVALTNVFFTNNVNANVTQVFNNGYVAGYSVVFTNTLTNTVTAYNLSNALLQSKQVALYATNYAYWTGSNYLGRFAGIVDWTISGGDDGGANPSTAPAKIPADLYGSLTGTNAWFKLTNGFVTASNISVAFVTAGVTSYGTPLVNPGFATLYSLDHWELYNRTNWIDYQFFGTRTIPVNPWQFATKQYVDNQVSIFTANNFASFTDATGATNHYQYSYQNHSMFDMVANVSWVQLASSSADTNGIVDPATGCFMPTNFVIVVAQTNLLPGYVVQISTNLLTGMAGFQTMTNYSVTTNSGMVSFRIVSGGIPTVPPAAFFRLVSFGNFLTYVWTPLLVEGGVIYPSNTWNFVSISNSLPIGAKWVGDSNGSPTLVTVWRSNASACYYVIQSNSVVLKIPAP